jgi:hypothetical protein
LLLLGLVLAVIVVVVVSLAPISPGIFVTQATAQVELSGKPASGQKGTGGVGQAPETSAKGEAAPADVEAPVKDEKKSAEQAPGEAPADPSQTQKVSPVEIFKDPIAEELLSLKKFRPIGNRAPMPGDLETVRTMAGDVNAPVDRTLIQRLVDGMVAQLTDPKNIQALIDPPPGSNRASPSAQAIEQATKNLTELLYSARGAQNARFLNTYNNILLHSLAPLLKHHLVPRIQAMIILGQTGNPDAYKLFIDEIKNPQQTIWVKLWAIRGITAIKKHSAVRLTASQDIEAARLLADLVSDKNKEVPWPVQLRALEALACLRQGFVPSSPKSAEMAVAVMRILTDSKARSDVRAEAAKALGMMQITSAVSHYNFGLVAYATAQLVAHVGDQIVANYSEAGKPLNVTKAVYLTTLLIGPIYQAFEGQPEARESGLMHVNGGAARGDVEKVLEQTRPVVVAAFELVRAPTGQIKARRKDLVDRVTGLKEYLAKNAPANHHLVPGDDGFLEEAGAQAVLGAAQPAAAQVAGAHGDK